MPYVVTKPEAIRGVYEGWDECEAAVRGVSGAVYQKVKSLREAEAVLEGTGVALDPGFYAFTDGNHRGGIGVVIVWVPEDAETQPKILQERATSVWEVLRSSGIQSLATEQAISHALRQLRNVLAELGALYLAIRLAIRLLPQGSHVSVVYDYEGVAAFMEGRWQPSNLIVEQVIAGCRTLAAGKQLHLTFLHQPGHMSEWAGAMTLPASMTESISLRQKVQASKGQVLSAL